MTRPVLLAALALALSSCGFFRIKKTGEGVPAVKKTSVYEEFHVAPGGSLTATKSGVTVTIEPIHEGNIATFPQFQGSFVLTKMKRNQLNTWTTTGQEVQQKCVLTDQPLAFKITIVNKTGHVLSLKGARVSLREPSGAAHASVPPGALESMWAEWSLQNNMKTTQTGLRVENFNGMWEAIRSVPWFLESAEILPDATGVFFANMDTNAESRAIMQNVTLSVFDVTTEVNPAGEATKRDRFDFELSRQLVER